jgi:hypothetical protein
MTNINVSRLTVGGVGEAGRPLIGSLRNGNPPMIFRAVVQEIFVNPKILTAQEKTSIKASVSNPQFVDLMPAMSIMARVINNGQDMIDSTSVIVYPFFSSHIQLPLQAGETVFVIYEDYTYLGSSLGRWITRPHENIAVEDLNFTHSDRSFDMKNTKEGFEQLKQETGTANLDVQPNFTNGAGQPGRYTLQPRNQNENPFKTIRESSHAAKLQTYEVVPRFFKNPKDLAIQGSNNTLILLTDDFAKKNETATGNNFTSADYSGIISIVAGRGRKFLSDDQNTIDETSKTSAFSVKNKFNKFETDKTEFQRNREFNLNEGKLDFKRDASHLYISMNSKADLYFKLDSNVDGGIRFPTNTLKLNQPATVSNYYGNAYIVQKSDHLRFIARKNTNPDINGTIMIIKEGEKDNDLSFIYLNEEGKIQIEGKKIFLGKATQENEPYIKWSVYKKHIDELKSQINIIADHLNLLVKTYEAAFKTSIAIPFAPIASLNALTATPVGAIATEGKITQLKAKIESINPDEAKSTKIFGE